MTSRLPVTLVVLAKHPVPGRCKTRLSPPCTPAQAATLARAALLDTLASARQVAAHRHVLALDGPADAWAGLGFDVIPQRGGGLAERLAGAFADTLRDRDGPALLIGMDTPQLGAPELASAAGQLLEPGVDAALGPAEDGGYWAIGLHRPDDDVFDGVPMSADTTGAAQLARLHALGLGVRLLPAGRDVDRWVDALHVAACAPGTRFAAAARAVARALEEVA